MKLLGQTILVITGDGSGTGTPQESTNSRIITWACTPPPIAEEINWTPESNSCSVDLLSHGLDFEPMLCQHALLHS